MYNKIYRIRTVKLYMKSKMYRIRMVMLLESNLKNVRIRSIICTAPNELNRGHAKHPPPYTPFVNTFGDVWPTPEPLSAVLGTNVRFRAVIQRATTEQLYRQLVVPNSADRGSCVGQTSPKIMTKGGQGYLTLYT